MPGPGRPVELREIPLPDLENDAALLRVELSSGSIWRSRARA